MIGKSWQSAKSHESQFRKLRREPKDPTSGGDCSQLRKSYPDSDNRLWQDFEKALIPAFSGMTGI